MTEIEQAISEALDSNKDTALIGLRKIRSNSLGWLIQQHKQIQSQKEEIELKDSEYQATITKLNKLTQTINSHGPEGRNYTNQQYVDLLQKFESLKAITEIALKGLKDIYSNELTNSVASKIAGYNLSEIAKLNTATTSLS